MASLAYVIRLCADLAQRMPSARLWMRAFILQLARVAVRLTRSRPRSLADVHQWHPLHPGQPRERAVRDAIALRQHPAAAHDYENRTWVVTTKLQKFEDGKLFIAVEPVFGHLPEITPNALVANTQYEGMPYHITLGKPMGVCDVEQLADVVEGAHELRLLKWRPHNRSSSTYLPVGSLHEACASCAQLGFKPRGEWHISL